MTDMDIDYTLESFRVPDLYLRSQELPPKSGRVPDNDQIYFFYFFRYIRTYYIKLYVLCETNPLVHSKSLMDVILGVRNILHGSRKLYQEHSLSIIRY